MAAKSGYRGAWFLMMSRTRSDATAAGACTQGYCDVSPMSLRKVLCQPWRLCWHRHRTFHLLSWGACCHADPGCSEAETGMPHMGRAAQRQHERPHLLAGCSATGLLMMPWPRWTLVAGALLPLLQLRSCQGEHL